MGNSNQERRKYQRVKKNFILSYYEIHKPTQKYAASQLRNISLGGICLITPQPFPQGTVLGFNIKTPFLIEMASLEGEVLQSHEKVKNIIYETRIKFRDLSPVAVQALNNVIEYFSKSELEP